jgi:hypothetical protein
MVTCLPESKQTVIVKFINLVETSYIGRSATLVKRNNIFKKYSDLGRDYNEFDTFQLKKLLERQKKWLCVIDFLNLFSNIVVVTWMYLDNFDFVGNEYILSDSMNNARIMCVGLSIASCLLLTIRNFHKRKYRVIQYVLNIRTSSIFKLI